jgi:hypothetical protein
MVVVDLVAGPLLEPACIGLHGTAGNGFNDPAGLAHEVIVVLAGRFIAGFAIGKLDLPRLAFTLESPRSAKHR